MKIKLVELPNEKRCSKCSAIKPLDAFPKKKAGKFGRAAHCRQCAAEYWLDYKQYRETGKLHAPVTMVGGLTPPRPDKVFLGKPGKPLAQVFVRDKDDHL